MVLTLLMAVTLPNVPSAYAGVPCVGTGPENLTISADTTLASTVLGDVFVNSGAELIMDSGSCVGKNVFLEQGASLVMNGNARVGDSVFVKSEGSDTSVTLNDNARVGGDLLVEGKGGSIDVSINGMTGVIIGGDILIKESTGTLQVIGNWSVSGDVLVEGKVSSITISENELTNPFDVQGDINIKEANGQVSITNTRVAGDININGVNGLVSITNTDVTGDVIVENKKSNGPLTLDNNKISGDLLLKKNTANNILIGDTNNNNEMCPPALASFSFSGKFVMEGNEATVTDITITCNSFEDLEMKENTAASEILLESNRLSKNILAEKNMGGSFEIINNSAGEKFLCKENSPAPTGSGNTGELEEQCAGLS